MLKAQHFASALVIAAGLSMISAACGSVQGSVVYQRDYRDFERRAYDTGFRNGVVNGQRDARERREFRVERDRDYRNADDGYRGFGDRDAYRRLFRDGYRAGYAEGYNRIAGGPGGSVSPAARIGYRDGYEAGRDDARDRDRFDPRREKRYREGDHDYDNRYGSRDEYRREYRAAFENGYAQGYREARR